MKHDVRTLPFVMLILMWYTEMSWVPSAPIFVCIQQESRQGTLAGIIPHDG